jgi:glycogen debranching enzyme
MKTICFLFILSFSMLQVKAADPVEQTVSLLKQSTWADLYKTFAKNVDLNILGDGDIYAKDQAEIILNNFFTKNQPFTVKLIHQVNSNADLKYMVVALTAKSGTYRTSISLRNNNGTFQINELHIEAEKAK